MEEVCGGPSLASPQSSKSNAVWATPTVCKRPRQEAVDPLMRLLDKQCLSREDLEADAYLSKPCPQLPRKNQLGSPLLPRLFLLEAGQLERHEMSTRQSIRCSENRSCEIGHSRNAALLGANQLPMLSLSLELRSSPLEVSRKNSGSCLRLSTSGLLPKA